MYQIGQVIFVVLAKKNHVYPMQVVEVITKKSLKGEEVKYVLQAGSDKKSTVILDQLQGEVFKSAEEARTTLVKRATSQISKLVTMAVAKSKEWYGTIENEQVIPTLMEDHPSPQEDDEDEEPSVTLPDGTIAKVKLPSLP